MKKHLPFLVFLFVGSAVLLTSGASAAWAHGGPPPWAGGGDHHDRKDWRGRRGEKGRHEDRGRHEGWYRDGRGRYRFDDHGRRAVIAYFRSRRDDRDFRKRWREDDRGYYPPVAYGYVIAPRYRPYCRPLPVGLVEELATPPPGFRYFLFGGSVVLVNNGYRVQDFIHLGFNFGG